ALLLADGVPAGRRPDVAGRASGPRRGPAAPGRRPGPFAAGTASGGRVALPEGAGGGRGGRTDGEEPARRGRPPLPRAEEVACPAGHPGGGRGMTGDPADAADREGRLNAVLLAYLEAAQAGPAPDRGRLLAAHPDLAPELEEFFAGHDVAE